MHDYPPARRAPQVDTVHGVAVADPYRWLEDGQSDETRAFVKAEDAYARGRLAKLPRRDVIAARTRELLYVETTGIPQHVRGQYFFARREAGKEKAAVYMRDRRLGNDRVLLDPNTWSQDGSVSLGTWSVSPDGRKLAYAVKANNSDEATLHVLDVASLAVSDVDAIEGAKYASPSWLPGSDGFYYTWVPPLAEVSAPERPGKAEVRLHKLGDDPARDAVVHGPTNDPKSFIGASVDRSGRYVVLTIEHGWSRSDVYFLDRKDKAPEWRPLVVGQDARYDVQVDRGQFFVLTNEGAPKYRVLRVDPAHPERSAWSEIVPERKDATLEGMSIVGHRLSLGYLKDVVSHVELREADGKLVREIALPGIGTSGALSGEPDDDVAFYAFQSFTIPTEIFETSVGGTGETSSWAKMKVPVDPSKYAVTQHFTTSRDGTRVPYFVIAPADFVPTASAPTMLYGYGGFQAALTPAFQSSIYPWLEQGGVWVVANLRGGSEYGEGWHRLGMRRQKQNVFDDFFAVAEALIRERITQPSRLAILGASNGGLLVGAAITQRPDLFAAALCGVPLLDMVRYSLFGSGNTWIEEYGSASDPGDFAALYAYSPVHHVASGVKYPATLLLSADSDDRVDPMHARKFAAELQAASRGGPVLLRVEHHSGHGGADLVRAAVDKIADEYAFALAAMDLRTRDVPDGGGPAPPDVSDGG